MFQWALNEEVPMLSVHEAFAVKAKDEGITMERLGKEWVYALRKKAQNL
jgi:hypothetical protein